MSARLSPATERQLAADVVRPGYDRAAQAIGIVHFGIGAFHRAHQAVYTDAAMAAGDRNWGIAGVSLRSGDVRDSLAPQNGLYTVTERGGGRERTTLIGAVRDLIVAPECPAAVTDVLAAPTVHAVTLTVTEKAYHLSSDGLLDLDRAAAAGGTIYHHLADGFAARRAAGLPGLSIISCDNLGGNGALLSAALSTWLDRVDPVLRRWFGAECVCPTTMVDRIVPAVTPVDLDRVAGAIGLRDEGAVITEPFRQWVIEDRFAGPRPRWETGGAQFVTDVAPFETAKLRMLNGAHSALAYLGLLAGHTHVHEAIADPAIAGSVDRLMRQEAAASLTPAAGQDLSTYADALVVRFANAALPHRLAQIATDGSQKIPQRWLEPLAVHARHGRCSPATLRALAAWLLHVRGDGVPVVDPLAGRLAAAWNAAGRDGIVDAVFGADGFWAQLWVPNDVDRAIVADALRQLDPA